MSTSLFFFIPFLFFLTKFRYSTADVSDGICYFSSRQNSRQPWPFLLFLLYRIRFFCSFERWVFSLWKFDKEPLWHYVFPLLIDYLYVKIKSIPERLCTFVDFCLGSPYFCNLISVCISCPLACFSFSLVCLFIFCS